jgi:hypothetical protein
MQTNPYTAPTTEVIIQQPAELIPPEVLKKIKNAWVVGIVSGCMTLVATLIAMYGMSLLGLNAWNLLDAALIFGLAFGIYKKSRSCAVLMLIYFVASKIIIIADTGKFSSAFFSIIFIYFYVQGVIGTFTYHKRLKQNDGAMQGSM